MRRFSALLTLALLAGPLAAQDAPPAPHLDLETAIRLALERNQNIKVQAYSPEIARANWLQALGQFDPAITFSRSSSRNGAPTAADPLVASQVKVDNYSLALQGSLPTGTTYNLGGTALNQRGTFNNFTDEYATFGGITLTQPLLRGFGLGANLVNLRVARANRSISQWQYRQTLIDTVTAVVASYTNLWLAHEEYQIALRSRELSETLLKQNVQRLNAGSGSQSEVTTARAQVATRQEAILVFQNVVRSADNQLRELTGETAFGPNLPLLAVDPPDAPPIAVDPAADLLQALAQRPDYQGARLGLVINRANESAARNSLLPQVDLVASYGYNGLDHNFAASRHLVSTGAMPSSSLGVNVSIPIANAVGRGRARAARLEREQAEANVRRLAADIAVSVANAGNQIETTRQRVVADRAAYNLAKQALADEEKKMLAGQSSTLYVIQEQEILIGEENNLARAQADVRQAVAAYDQQLGATLPRNHINLAEDE